MSFYCFILTFAGFGAGVGTRLRVRGSGRCMGFSEPAFMTCCMASDHTISTEPKIGNLPMTAQSSLRWMRAAANEQDELLDRFMSLYEVMERHHVHVEAPAAVTLAAARDMDLSEVPVAARCSRHAN
jgi:hypothetical protein